MDSPNYQVILEGRTLHGRERDSVASDLATLFKRKLEQMQALLGGNETVLRSGLSHTKRGNIPDDN
jgi:hypothetical protein